MVSDVAATLQRAGLITYRRGFVTIVDRERLEAAACECYAVSAAIVASVKRARPRGPRAERYAEDFARLQG